MTSSNIRGTLHRRSARVQYGGGNVERDWRIAFNLELAGAATKN